jgi:phosphopantothenoylcysteine decarboxylase/phosphopantothenate--cysteine ligase
VGPGRLADTGRILRAVVDAIADRPIRQPDRTLRPPQSSPVRPRDLDGWHLVITAGGTAEPIDPVRYIGNRSTGKMGVAVAEAALARGARVTLIAGMTSVPLPESATTIHAPTAAEMGAAVLTALPSADALIMAAAVADFRPRQAATGKIGRQAGLTLELEPTADILAEASEVARRQSSRPLLVGFAAETGSLERAQAKAERKGVDLLVGNDVAEEGSGFGTSTNRVTIFSPGAPPEAWPLMTKREVADRLLDRLVGLRAAAGASLAAT